MNSHKIDQAIKLIQSGAEMAEKKGQPIEVSYSGGKDSDVILRLTQMAGVNYRAIYKNTTIDPSGTISHVKKNGVEIIQPKYNFLQLLSKKGFPNRFTRFCCQVLKEYKVLDYSILGVRKDESIKRTKRYTEPEQCRTYANGSKVRQYYPILNWTLADVADFIIEQKIELAPTYYTEDGTIDFSRRLGCLGCPLATFKKRISDFETYPNLIKLWLRGGGQYIDNHQDRESLQRYFNRDVYKMFVCNLFCDSKVTEFEERFGRNLFDEGMDCKAFLEERFKISL